MEKELLKCDLCGSTEHLQRCGFCKRAFYCSRDHQTKDWKRHKELCKKIKAANACLATSTHYSNPNVNSGPDNHEGNTHGNKSGTSSDSTEQDGKKGHTQTVKLTGKEASDDDKGIPFDERQYRPCKTLTIPSNMSSDQIGKVVVNHLLKDGFCIVDNLFSDDDIENALENVHECDKTGLFNSGRLAGGKTCDDVAKQVVDFGRRSDKIMWVEGVEDHIPGIRKIVSQMDEILGTFNIFLGGRYDIYKRTKAMIACYPGNGSYYKRHIDNPSGDGRVVTCILYLNKDWNVEENGGFLRILPLDSDDYMDVAPQANRLLFFWSDKRNPHEVHPAFKTRYAITVWYFDKNEREKAKQGGNPNSALQTSEGYSLSDQESSQNPQTEVDRQIEDVASSAISSLSLEELQAIAAIIKDEANPGDILTEMGISTTIQEKLLQKLKQI